MYPHTCRQEDLLLCYLKCVLLSPLMNFLVGIMIFHFWFNMLGELTRFGDREFYQVIYRLMSSQQCKDQFLSELVGR